MAEDQDKNKNQEEEERRTLNQIRKGEFLLSKEANNEMDKVIDNEQVTKKPGNLGPLSNNQKKAEDAINKEHLQEENEPAEESEKQPSETKPSFVTSQENPVNTIPNSSPQGPDTNQIISSKRLTPFNNQDFKKESLDRLKQATNEDEIKAIMDTLANNPDILEDGIKNKKIPLPVEMESPAENKEIETLDPDKSKSPPKNSDPVSMPQGVNIMPNFNNREDSRPDETAINDKRSNPQTAPDKIGENIPKSPSEDTQRQEGGRGGGGLNAPQQEANKGKHDEEDKKKKHPLREKAKKKVEKEAVKVAVNALEWLIGPKKFLIIAGIIVVIIAVILITVMVPALLVECVKNVDPKCSTINSLSPISLDYEIGDSNMKVFEKGKEATSSTGNDTKTAEEERKKRTGN